MPMFRIRTRQIGGLPPLQQADAETFLGPNGVWSPAEKAIRFRSQHAAERALMEEWNRLRNAGNRSVILSVVSSRR